MQRAVFVAVALLVFGSHAGAGPQAAGKGAAAPVDDGGLEDLLSAIEKLSGTVQKNVKGGLASSGKAAGSVKASLESLAADLAKAFEGVTGDGSVPLAKNGKALPQDRQQALQRMKTFIESLGKDVNADVQSTLKKLEKMADGVK